MGEAYRTWIILYCTKALFACVALHVFSSVKMSKRKQATLGEFGFSKEVYVYSICVQYMKCSLFILIDVICYCLHTKSVIMKFKSDIYI